MSSTAEARAHHLAGHAAAVVSVAAADVALDPVALSRPGHTVTYGHPQLSAANAAFIAYAGPWGQALHEAGHAGPTPAAVHQLLDDPANHEDAATVRDLHHNITEAWGRRAAYAREQAWAERLHALTPAIRALAAALLNGDELTHTTAAAIVAAHPSPTPWASRP